MGKENTGSEFSREAPKCIDSSMISTLAPYRPADGHKGTFGTLLIRAGSPGMDGAAIMCCTAGLRSGTGLVRLISGRQIAGPLLNTCPQAVFDAAPESVDDIVSLLKTRSDEADAVVYGPGLDPEAESAETELSVLISEVPRLLLDAGAISVLRNHRDTIFPMLIRRKASALPPPVLTPHPGEFSRLMPEWEKSDRVSLPGRFARDNGVVLVLKGHETAVFTPGGLWYINTVGNDGLAKGGSGDVLSGLIGGYMAQGIDPESAAIAGVYFHGLSGDIVSRRLGRRFMQPTDLFDGLPEAYRSCGWQ
ncbi:MAG: NAD(P)H-hydrate dehydratase [Clostridiaceae bacterium]|jgi:NAD(P)H-hydrate epimerase|nr:NAD(P)H-hydrate dehydratase [Clostridiaceae bacterium]